MSNFEIRLDDATRPRQDPALTVAFRSNRPPKAIPARSHPGVLAWTTTPWTLPSNQALIVGEDIDYDLVELGTRSSTSSAATVRVNYERELGEGELVATVKGEAIWSAAATCRCSTTSPIEADSFRVLSDGFVGTTDGTGIVHAPPATVRTTNASAPRPGWITLVCPVDDSGRYTAEVIRLGRRQRASTPTR
jgi:isoleucyl-tRNA synthetase